MSRGELNRGSDHAGRLSAAASNIRIDAITAEVARAFEAARVDCVLLKGRALADWYGRDVPFYNDADLWVGPSEVDRARNVLAELGFARVLDTRRLPDWWQEHGDAWRREQDGGEIDLHHRLQGVGVAAADAWAVLADHLEPVLVGGQTLWRLSTAARALYVTIHAGHHGRIWTKAISHMQAALEQVPPTAWEEAAALAARLDATEGFSAGLHLTPEGTARAAALGLPQATSASIRLQAASPPPVARGLEQLATAGWRHRLEILVRKFAPPPEFVRHWWPPAGRGPGWLALGYLYRPIWLIRHTPGGWRAWRSVRRRSR